jgi:hypothetical protein
MLAGCASTLSPEQQSKIDAAERLQGADRLVQERIAESTTSIANTLSLIERIERGAVNQRIASGEKVPTSTGSSSVDSYVSKSSGAMSVAVQPKATSGHAGPAVVGVGPGMQAGYVNTMLDARLQIQWKNGSAEELLRTLANQMGIPFKVSGEKKQLNPVSVVSENASMGSILSSVGRQIDRGADIVLNKTQQPVVLELRFK